MSKGRFLSLVDQTGECWEWKGGVHARGYGRFTLNGRRMPAHRASYALFVGAVPDHLLVCHRCDNKRCVRPEHLFLGTQHDNMMDWTRKGLNKAVVNGTLTKRGNDHWMSSTTARGRAEIERRAAIARREFATGKRSVMQDSRGRLMGTKVCK